MWLHTKCLIVMVCCQVCDSLGYRNLDKTYIRVYLSWRLMKHVDFLRKLGKFHIFVFLASWITMLFYLSAISMWHEFMYECHLKLIMLLRVNVYEFQSLVLLFTFGWIGCGMRVYYVYVLLCSNWSSCMRRFISLSFWLRIDKDE